ncbi:MAG TPA: DUF6763 family protein [Gammaproteobacteria bacterium]|nr:DUF6763 family protein [Gammaproteobacteria bacterium]
MSAKIEPVIGNWYRAEDASSFEVIAVDDDAIEIQYFDGGIEGLDMASWQEMELEEIEPPEDWSGPFDDLEKDDLGYTDMHEDDYSGEGTG